MTTQRLEKLVRVFAIAGVVAAAVAFYFRSQVYGEYVACVAKVGRFEITAEQKVHLKQFETDNPEEFDWQYYFPPLPPNAGVQKLAFSGGVRDGGSSHYGGELEGTYRVAVRRTPNGPEACGLGLMINISDPIPARFIEEHWSELEFSCGGSDGTLIQDVDKVVKLFEARLQNRLVKEFVAAHGTEHESKVACPFAFYVGSSNATDWSK